MTIEVALVVSVVSVSLAFCFGFATWKRKKSHDDKSDASELTTVIVSLESIKDGIKEIKIETSNVKAEVRELRDGNIRTEESLKSAWRRIEAIENKIIGKG